MESLLAAGAGGVGMAAVAAVGGLVTAVVALGAGRIGPAPAAPRSGSPNNPPPAIPGLPIIGNLHQLKSAKPNKIFAEWSETYGPVYSIRTGDSSVVVLNSTEVAKEATIEKFSSISTRKLPKAMSVMTRNKSTVALSDYGDFYKTTKRNLMLSMLGFSAQKQFGQTRDMMVNNMMITFNEMLSDDPQAPLNFRNVFRDELFRLALIQSLGEDVGSVYVDEFGRNVSKEEIFNTTVDEMMKCAIQVDWREFFPKLSWVPNRSFETRVFTLTDNRNIVMRALVKQQKERIARGEARISYLDFLVADNTLTDEQLSLLVWETIVESSDTTLVTAEWAMFELAKNPEKQDRLYQEIREVCGDEAVTEDHLPRLPYLNAVVHETLRRHSAVPLLPPKLVHEDTRLAGYDVPAGTELVINVYACNMNGKEWESPEEWSPERFLDGRHKLENMHKTLAFGAGRRACAGALQATTIASLSIARFVQEFEWRVRDGDEDNVDSVHITAYKSHPLLVHLTPRGRM